jgi:YfiH family protein
MKVIYPEIFKNFPEIIAAQSTKIGGVSPEPYGMNLSSHVGDTRENVAKNRRMFFAEIGVPEGTRAVYQNQIHATSMTVVHGGEGIVRNSDALITLQPNVLLAITVADCVPMLIYEPNKQVIASVHAGWRGTEQMIAKSVIKKLKDMGAKPKDMYIFIGAAASGEHYEVGSDVATLFEKKYIKEQGDDKFLLDLKLANFDQLVFGGVPESHIEVSPLCTISDPTLHSYRRDGKKSGRMLAVIERVGTT